MDLENHYQMMHGKNIAERMPENREGNSKITMNGTEDSRRFRLEEEDEGITGKTTGEKEENNYLKYFEGRKNYLTKSNLLS